MIENIGIQYYLVIGFGVLSFVITLSNIKFFNFLNDSVVTLDGQNEPPWVSVLVPARNEEANISKCISALIKQNYKLLEIIVLDDRSDDCTSDLVSKFVASNSKVKLISGLPLPDGWTGKNWACHQLSQASGGDFLLFIDADTILSEDSVSNALIESMDHSVDLLTVMPHRISSCVIEWLMYPFIDWVSFCWMPMYMAAKSKSPNLSATFGQFILFTREAYNIIGGHKVIAVNPLDDFELGRMVKRHGLKWMLFGCTNSVKVLSYQGNLDAFKGVSRSVFPALYYRVSVLMLLVFGLILFTLLPPITIVLSTMAYYQESHFLLMAFVSLSMFTISWIIVCRKFHHSLLTIPFYPVAVVLMVLVAFYSLISYSFGVTSWKNRKIVRRRISL